MSANTRWFAALCVVLLLGLLTGCGPTFGDLPLPGSGVSGSTQQVTVEFDDALNLADGALVKVDGVDAGRVRSVRVRDFTAQALLEVRRSADLRVAATYRLRYTTPLGELFVDVTNPDRGQRLRDGAHVSARRSSTAPTVEDALAQASLLINGGGLTQLQTVTDELNSALGGREETVRRLLLRLASFLDDADATTTDVGRALDALARLSVELRARQGTIKRALHQVRPAAKVLRTNTPGITRLLRKLERFAGTANGVVGRTRQDLLTMIREVGPLLQEFLDNRARLGPSLLDLVSLGHTVDTFLPGDYANLHLIMEMDNTTFPGGPQAGGNGGPGGEPGGGGDLGGLLGGGLGNGLLGGGRP